MRLLLSIFLFALALPGTPAMARGWHSHGGGFRSHSSYRSHSSFRSHGSSLAHTATHGFAAGMGHAAGAALGRRLFSGHDHYRRAAYGADDRYLADEGYTTDTTPVSTNPAPAPQAPMTMGQTPNSPLPAANHDTSTGSASSGSNWPGVLVLLGAAYFWWQRKHHHCAAPAASGTANLSQQAQIRDQVYQRMSAAVLSEQEMRRYPHR